MIHRPYYLAKLLFQVSGNSSSKLARIKWMGNLVELSSVQICTWFVPGITNFATQTNGKECSKNLCCIAFELPMFSKCKTYALFVVTGVIHTNIILSNVFLAAHPYTLRAQKCLQTKPTINPSNTFANIIFEQILGATKLKLICLIDKTVCFVYGTIFRANTFNKAIGVILKSLL